MGLTCFVIIGIFAQALAFFLLLAATSAFRCAPRVLHRLSVVLFACYIGFPLCSSRLGNVSTSNQAAED